MDENGTIIKVRSNGNPGALAGAIAGVYRDEGRACAQAIGAGAVNQMVKATAIAIKFLAQEGIILACLPEFIEIDTDLTAIRLTLVERDGS